jgi:hypothetical protein
MYNEYLTEEQYIKLSLKAIKNNGLSLIHIKIQTEEICLEAVKQNGNALEFVETTE